MLCSNLMRVKQKILNGGSSSCADCNRLHRFFAFLAGFFAASNRFPGKNVPASTDSNHGEFANTPETEIEHWKPDWPPISIAFSQAGRVRSDIWTRPLPSFPHWGRSAMTLEHLDELGSECQTCPYLSTLFSDLNNRAFPLTRIYADRFAVDLGFRFIGQAKALGDAQR